MPHHARLDGLPEFVNCEFGEKAITLTKAGLMQDRDAFMRILTADFVTHYRGRLLNIHPSLLPRHKGLQTHQRALDAGDEEHGASIHFVTEELDGGPVVIQGRVTVHPDDDAASLASRVQVKEHALYPLAARWFATGRLRLEGDQACLDGTPIPPSGLRLEDIESGR